MTIEESLTIEAVKVVLSGISWKESEWDMTDDERNAIRPFLNCLKEKYPELSDSDASDLF